MTAIILANNDGFSWVPVAASGLICYASAMRALFVLAALSLAGWAAAATDFGRRWDWHTSLSPHFQVYHEKAFMPGGFSMALEKIHGRLRFDLSTFSPWMSKERLKLYLYQDKETYSKGEFKPPAWSNGISMYEKRTVAVYDQPDRRKLIDVIAHETTHLLFESYWGELGRRPPSWLNEGLAMVEEADPQHPENSDWFRAMIRLPEKGYVPIAKLVAIIPTEHLKNDSDAVATWYVQSYSLVYFLLRGHSRLQFKSFCAKLRDGAPLEQALWLSFRYSSLAKLEKDWLAWLRGPGVRSALSRRRAGAP
jgi:hypothetical protein